MDALQSDTDSYSNPHLITRATKISSAFPENLLDAETDEVNRKEKTTMLMQQSGRLGSKFKREIFEKRQEPAQAEENSLAEINKAKTPQPEQSAQRDRRHAEKGPPGK